MYQYEQIIEINSVCVNNNIFKYSEQVMCTHWYT